MIIRITALIVLLRLFVEVFCSRNEGLEVGNNFIPLYHLTENFQCLSQQPAVTLGDELCSEIYPLMAEMRILVSGKGCVIGQSINLWLCESRRQSLLIFQNTVQIPASCVQYPQREKMHSPGPAH